MMDADDIEKVNEWFDAHTEYYGTSRSEREYSVSQYDLESFADFLRENFLDLCCIRCYFGPGDSAIWFFREDLEKAEFY